MSQSSTVFGLVSRIEGFKKLSENLDWLNGSSGLENTGKTRSIKPQDMMGFFFRYQARKKASLLPRVHTSISVWTPDGRSAIEIQI